MKLQQLQRHNASLTTSNQNNAKQNRNARLIDIVSIGEVYDEDEMNKLFTTDSRYNRKKLN